MVPKTPFIDAKKNNLEQKKGQTQLKPEALHKIQYELKNKNNFNLIFNSNPVNLTKSLPYSVSPKERVNQQNKPHKRFSHLSFNVSIQPTTAFCTELCQATVLLVDDVDFNLIPLEEMLLQSFGIKCATFTQG